MIPVLWIVSGMDKIPAPIIVFTTLTEVDMNVAPSEEWVFTFNSCFWPWISFEFDIFIKKDVHTRHR